MTEETQTFTIGSPPFARNNIGLREPGNNGLAIGNP